MNTKEASKRVEKSKNSGRYTIVQKPSFIRMAAVSIGKSIIWLITVFISILALSAAVAPHIYEDPSELCTTKTESREIGEVFKIMTWANSLLVDCSTISPENAQPFIANYFARAAGANPFRGWETLSLGLQTRWSYDAFSTQWGYVGYAEVLEVVGNDDGEAQGGEMQLELPHNTFEVTVRIYQLDPADNKDESQIAAGWLGHFKYHVRLREEAGTWAIDRVYSMDYNNGERPYGNFGVLRLDKDKSSYSETKKDVSLITYTNKKIDTGRLPFFCKKKVNSVEGATVWYRTSIGWVEAGDRDTSPSWTRGTKIENFNGECKKESLLIKD